jgi:uracil-DNA glycosylase
VNPNPNSTGRDPRRSAREESKNDGRKLKRPHRVQPKAMEEELVPCGWEDFFRKAASEIADIHGRLAQTRYFPAFGDIYKAFHYLRPSEIRVVIVGQDPYPGVDEEGRPIATGVPFAIRGGVKLTTSLENIIADLAQTAPGFAPPKRGDLTPWLRQGVFLLNSRLTVPIRREDPPHDFWAGLILMFVEYIQEVNPDVIFVFWGNVAKELKRALRGTVVSFEACHPSGRNGKLFVGAGTLQAVNEEFQKRGEPLINWQF